MCTTKLLTTVRTRGVTAAEAKGSSGYNKARLARRVVVAVAAAVVVVPVALRVLVAAAVVVTVAVAVVVVQATAEVPLAVRGMRLPHARCVRV
jgi:hypothetical protein